MDATEDEDFDDNDYEDKKSEYDNKPGSNGKNSPGFQSSSSSGNNSMNPSPSVSSSSVLNSSATLNRTNWKTTNAFLNYVQDFRQKLREMNKVVHPANVVGLAAQEWRLLPDDQKKIYVEGALAIKMIKPKTVSERKPRRNRVKKRSRVKRGKLASLLRGNFKKTNRKN
ncbi:uncharacterized protein LOC135166200 [Diachasmimorpha longicaudata]|uniref:uncharacterized protein LOC135166200 n=1 Tax=Diachasmimorpha longicaudata TaxID=58733 RepID=UPI0030B89514